MEKKTLIPKSARKRSYLNRRNVEKISTEFKHLGRQNRQGLKPVIDSGLLIYLELFSCGSGTWQLRSNKLAERENAHRAGSSTGTRLRRRNWQARPNLSNSGKWCVRGWKSGYGGCARTESVSHSFYSRYQLSRQTDYLAKERSKIRDFGCTAQ